MYWASMVHIAPVHLNPYPVDFFRTFFHSFEAGIANTISSSK